MTPLRQRRIDLGLGQVAVAHAAGLSRQALSALEAGRATPSLASALALARALGTTVEALFGQPSTGAAPSRWDGVVPADGRVRWARLDGRLVVRPAGPDEEVDAVVGRSAGRPEELLPLPGAADPDRVVWLGGCDPALGLLAAAMERAAPHLNVRAIPMTTGEARTALAAGQVHVASLHGAIEKAAGGRARPYVSWREGFALAQGLEAEGLSHPSVRWALRPKGATARSLFERLGPKPHPRASLVLPGHWAVAEAIRAGQADAGVTIEAAAAAFGLPFVPLEEEAVELAVHPSAVEAADALERAFSDDRLWSRLGALRGYRRTSA